LPPQYAGTDPFRSLQILEAQKRDDAIAQFRRYSGRIDAKEAQKSSQAG
jgi:hypothetical protein